MPNFRDTHEVTADEIRSQSLGPVQSITGNEARYLIYKIKTLWFFPKRAITPPGACVVNYR